MLFLLKSATGRTGCTKGGTMNCPKAADFPASTVAVTVLVAVSITETLLLSRLATYALVPSGVNATP